MQNHDAPKAAAKAREDAHTPWQAMALAGAALILGLVAISANAQELGEDGLIHASSISTFGEPGYGPDAPHLNYVNPDAPRGGEMSFAWSSGSFDSMHPYSRIGRPAVLSSIFFEPMLEGTADEIGSAYCLLCSEFAYPEDRSYVIFTLRDEVTFSDGTPMTAHDVLFSYEILRDEGLPSFQANIPNTIESAEIIDDRSIRYTFNPNAPLRDRIQTAGGLPVFSQASHEASGRDFEESRLEPLIGSAAYVLGEVDPGRRTIFVRNDDYWGDDLWLNQGRNNFDSIRIEYYGDSLAAFEGFTAGNYTFRQESSSQAWANNYDFPALENGTVVQAELPDGTIASGQSFMINLRRPQFQDVRVRSAIAHMFNFEWSNETLFYGLYSPVVSFWENTWMEAEGLPSEAELALLDPLRDQLPETVFTQEAYAVPPSNPDRALDRRQSRRATALLEEAGWTPGDDGMLRNADGDTLDVEFLNSSPLFDRIINPYVENLRAIGVNASLNRVDNAQLQQRQRDGDFDMITDHFAMGYEPGAGLRQYFGSLGADESLFNVPGLADEGIDALIEVVVNAETREELDVAVTALDRVLRDRVIRVGQWYNASHWVAYYDMYRYPEELPPYSLGFLDFWWIDAEAEQALRDQGAF